ncbi:MAG: MazG nucleotide pyrophosphohydrolase domain-containing protein [Candidatus Andersenbacteria bacterium]
MVLELPSNPTLAEVQRYVSELERQRGFSNETALQKCLLLGEEIGELFKAVRKMEKTIKIDPTSKVGSVKEELADILIYLCAIANKYDLDLEEAFREKEIKNKARVWV